MLVDRTQNGTPGPDSAAVTQAPAQPVGSQVGNSDPVLNAAAPMLRDWVTMWQAALPGFQVDSTWKVGIERWSMKHRLIERDLERLESETDLAFKLLSTRSPDGRYILDIDSYQMALVKNDTLEMGGEPDSQPLLLDLADSTEVVLQFCGPGCGFHWGAWLSPSRFALGGWQLADDYGHWYQGSLAIYSIRDLSVRRYETRVVSAGDYARYNAAWKRWLLGRHQRLPGGPQARGPRTRQPSGFQAVITPGP